MKPSPTSVAICLTAMAFTGMALAQAFTQTAPAADPASGGQHARHISECALTCDECAAHCARKLAEGKADHMRSLQLCQDCAAVCHAASAIAARKGPLSDVILIACAEACKRCGEQCVQLKDDKMMMRCADACRTCETHCREMLKRGFSK